MRVSKPVLLRILVVVVILHAGFIAFLWWAMRQPPEIFAGVMTRLPAPVVFVLAPFDTLWTQARAGSLRAGDPAPDFVLMKLDHSERIQLSSMTSHQPVVLVFGSYT